MLLILCRKFLLEFRSIHCLLLLVGNVGSCGILVKNCHLAVDEATLRIGRSTQRMHLTLQHYTRNTDSVLLDIDHKQEGCLSVDEIVITHSKPDTEHTAIGLIFRFDALFERIYHIVTTLYI